MRLWGALLIGCLSAGCVRSVQARAQNWWSARTEHVHLQTDGGHDRALAAANQLEDLHRALTIAFYHCPNRDDSEAIEVTLLSDEGEYQELARGESLGQLSHAMDGLFAVPERVLVSDPRAGDAGHASVFAHELTHRFVRQCFPDVPAWLNEGLARVFETIQVRAGRVLFGLPAYHFTEMPIAVDDWENNATVQLFPIQRIPSASQLTSMSSAAFYSARRDATGHRAIGDNYAAAWGLTHLLALGPDASLRARFLDYLQGLMGAEQDRAAAFQLAFYQVDLDRALEAYLRADRFAPQSRPWDRGARAEPVARAMPVPEAHLALAELWLQTRREGNLVPALAHLDEAERDSEWRPRALLLRATLVPEDAERDVAEAARLAPEDLDVLRARAIIADARADAPGAQALAALLAARADLRPVDLVVVAGIERQAGRLDEAFAHASAAVAGDAGYWPGWLELARVESARGDRELARRALQRVGNLARHSAPTIWRAAMEGIHRIDSGAPL